MVPLEELPRFDRTVHKAIKVTDAARAEDDGRVTQVLKRGFRRGERPLRPEEVVISRWRGREKG